MGNTWWSSGNEAAGKVKDKTLEDEVDAGKQSDQPEEELTSTKQTAMENVHHGETNMEKVLLHMTQQLLKHQQLHLRV